MADDNPSDLFMMFVPNKSGDPIPAEGRTSFLATGNGANPLMKGFKQGCVFEVESFSFKAGTADDSKGDTDNGDDAKAKKRAMDALDLAVSPAQRAALAKLQKPAKKPGSSSTKGGYQAWRSGNKNYKYPVDLRPVQFTRKIDSASSILLQSCIDCTSFDSVSLVKRKAAGGKAAGEAFLRMDFIGVLVTSMDWENDEEVKETCEFICRSVTISYRPQLPSGKLGAVVSGFWSMVPDEKQVVL